MQEDPRDASNQWDVEIGLFLAQLFFSPDPRQVRQELAYCNNQEGPRHVTSAFFRTADSSSHYLMIHILLLYYHFLFLPPLTPRRIVYFLVVFVLRCTSWMIVTLPIYTRLF